MSHRPDSQSWIDAKAKGDAAQNAAADFFTKRGMLVTMTHGRAPFDLLLQAQLEVKNDLRAVETNNVAIEIRYDGQPSGLMTTQATWWLIAVGAEGFLLKADSLRQCALGSPFKKVRGGDNNKSELILVPIQVIRQHTHAVIPILEGTT